MVEQIPFMVRHRAAELDAVVVTLSDDEVGVLQRSQH